MNEEFIKLDNKFAIKETLKAFSDRLPPLQNGETYIEGMVAKFQLYSEFIVLSVENEAIGFAAFYCNDTSSNMGYLLMIAISDKMAGLGYGKKLINEVFSTCRRNGMKSIKLEVNKNNEKVL